MTLGCNTPAHFARNILHQRVKVNNIRGILTELARIAVNCTFAAMGNSCGVHHDGCSSQDSLLLALDIITPLSRFWVGLDTLGSGTTLGFVW